MSFPRDCHLPLLWQLHLHVHKEGVAFNKGVAVLNTSVFPLLNPFIYTPRNKTSKTILQGHGQKDYECLMNVKASNSKESLNNIHKVPPH